jgi:RecA-family ATPase
MAAAVSIDWDLLEWPAILEASPDVPWLVEGLRLAPGAITIFAGRGYSRKTLSVQSLALSVACGMPVWEGDTPRERGDVVHLDYEQGKRLTADRYRRIARSMGANPMLYGPRALRLGDLPKPSLSVEASVDSLEAQIEGAKLVIVDSLAASMPGVDENSTVMRVPLDRLTKLSNRMQCTFILIHHARKDSQNPKATNDPLESLRGASAIVDAAQTIWHFDGDADRTVASLIKDRISGSVGVKRHIRSIDTDPQTLRITSATGGAQKAS